MKKKYDIYSIGNALVDIDFEITTELLEKNNIEKGVMTLIDSQRANELLKNFGHHSRAKNCAGSAVNTTILFAQLGGKAFYSGCVGQDELGDIFCALLKTHKIETNISQINRDHNVTGTCLVMVTPDTDRTMNTHLGAAITFSEKNIDVTALANAHYFYIEGYLLSSDSAFEAVLKGCKIAQKNQTKIVLTLSDRNLVKAFHDRFIQVMRHGVELVFCNELEAIAFTHANDIKEAGTALKHLVNIPVITLGPKGSLIFQENNIIESAAYDVCTIDSVGAGDTFAGSLLYGLANGLSCKAAAEIANFASGLVVAKYGTRLNDEEVTQIKEKIKAI